MGDFVKRQPQHIILQDVGSEMSTVDSKDNKACPIMDETSRRIHRGRYTTDVGDVQAFKTQL
jgi:hypothetical protein